jgi:Flp pilus assembly pilin Flp
MVKRMLETLRKLNRDEAGAMSVEKILILAIIALPILIVLLLFRQKIEGWFNTQATSLDQNNNNGG